MSPDDRKYTREHEWAKVDDAVTKLVSVGITDFAQDELGDIVYFDLPQAGDNVSHMEKMGEVESVKAVSDLFSPVTGRIEAVNDGWRIVQFPRAELYQFSDVDNTYLGYEFILVKSTSDL